MINNIYRRTNPNIYIEYVCNLKVVCDARNIITQVEAKWPGSVHDARIFRESNLNTRFARGELSLYLKDL
jgi:hypothetical protein